LEKIEPNKYSNLLRIISMKVQKRGCSMVDGWSAPILFLSVVILEATSECPSVTDTLVPSSFGFLLASSLPLL